MKKRTFKEFLVEAKYAFGKDEYEFINKRTFKPDALISPHSQQAQKILGRQLPKVETLATKLGIEWKAFYVKRFVQRDYRKERLVWTYILVGTDQYDNEITYYKYEGGTSGSGQSYIYANKRNRTKLSWAIDTSNTEINVRKKLGIA